MTTHPWHRLVAAVCVAALAMVASACGGAAPSGASKTAATAPTATKTGTASKTATPTSAVQKLTFGLSSEPPDIDPHHNSGTASATVKLQLYRGLFGFAANGSVQPELVQSYQQTNPTTYIFKLRPNLKFSDGSPLTAADVVYSFQRIKNPKNAAYEAKMLDAVKSVTAVNATTVKMQLSSPDAALLSKLALPYAAIVSKKFTEAHGGNLKDVALGEGPYMLKSWQHGVQLTVVKNPYYFKPGLPKTPEIVFKFYSDESARVAALESGAVDMIEYVPWQDISQIKANPSFGYQGVDGPFMYLVYNLNQKPFNDVRVRQAVGYAVDRNAIIKTAFFGRGTTIFGLPIPTTSLAYDPSLANYYTYDPAKAKQILAQAGYAKGITATLLSTSQYGMHKDTAEVVQQDLNAIGSHIKLNLPDWATRVSIGNQARYQFAVMGTAGDYNDPDFLSAFFHSGPVYYAAAPGYHDAKVNQLLDQARATLDKTKRKQLYFQMEKLALQDAPYTFLTWREQGYAYKKGVTGFTNLPGFLTFWSGYTLEDTTLPK